jgi:hypothetical protein
MDTIVPLTRHDDGAYGVWMGSQQDCWYDEMDEAEEEVSVHGEQLRHLELFEVDDLAIEIASTEGMPFVQVLQAAEAMLPGLRAYAQGWDWHAWLGGNEACAAF